MCHALHFIPSSFAHDVVVLILSTTFLSALCCPSSLSSSFSFSCSSLSSSMWVTRTLRTLADEDLGTLAENDPLTGYEPNDLHTSETTDIFIQESSGDNRSLNLHDLDFDDYTIGMALSSPLSTQERDAASRRQAYHSLDEGLSSSQSSSVGHVRTGRLLADQFDSLIPNVRENPCRGSENGQIRNLLEWQSESRFSLIFQAEIQKHEFQADYDQRSIQKLIGVIESQRGEIIVLIKETNNVDEINNNFFMNNYWNKIGIFVKLMRSLNEMEELKQFQGSTFDTISRRKLVEDRDTIFELTGKILELQNEINCMSDSRDFQDAESARSGQSHVASQPVFFPSQPVPGGILRCSLGMPSRNNGPPSIWDTYGISGNVFCKSNGVFFSTSSARVRSMDLQCISTHITTCVE